MAWENYALGVVALAGLEVLVTAAGQQNSGASNVGNLFGTVLPNFLNKIIDPSTPFFASQTSTATAQLDTATAPLPSTPAVLAPLTTPPT